MAENLVSRDKDVIWHPFTSLGSKEEPLPALKGDGVYIELEDGRRIIDGVSSWWVNLHGHGNKHIAKAVAEQAASLEHVIFAGFTHEPAVKLAEEVLSILPKNQKKVFYSDNGSTAVEVALKMAFQYWHNQRIEKKKVIAINGSYHGDTFGAMSVGDRDVFVKPFVPYLFDVEFIDFPGGDNQQAVLGQLADIIDTDDVAAFIYEPLVQGSAGMRMYDSEVLDTMLSMAKGAGVVCIADEVFTGFGRTGKMFASDHMRHKPDIMCLSKGLTGGTMALGATTCTLEIQKPFMTSDLIKTFFHGHSYTGNPIACAAGVASMELLKTPECQEQISQIGKWHKSSAVRLGGSRAIKNVRHLGTILAFEIKTLKDTGYFNEVRHKLYPTFLKYDVLLRPLGNVVYFLPPYCITKEEYDKVIEVIEKVLVEINS
ncbi:adenosylmethionine--8-amino-7-oxononanoate transaminase [Marinigracilibium pacificum]|uniref:Adenosylmethionine-8-amino-7-oxononanoate aminotransferase n=1 Tax=Marinigracilibium pacificum TaxID=2729599 RepID=A0A848J739_9BACT|nr:adenosylmethionine--8-amino-7-oxononanoate transaminase [Marinigracilibium pacificum]NMM50209.1 adenosylmethionine--8-amino-7-oxononanoate transaminase [Marinigracilibium pacificum]